jgi:predicted AAA+ superfamily ATPase
MKLRTLQEKLLALAGPFPVVFVTGPRQSGKTTLCRATFPTFLYFSMEDLQTREEATMDPRGFLRRLAGAAGAILDEVHRTPDIFSYLQGFVDDRKSGPVVLTGSQHFLLTERIGQTLAGRAAVLELLPFSVAELWERTALTPEQWTAGQRPGNDREPVEREGFMFSGLFPPIHDRSIPATDWLASYVGTYVERDVRTLGGIGDLNTFVRFLGLCAGRAGQLLNSSSLGSEAGVSHVTARKWLSILQASYVVDFLRPHHRNFSKRLVRTPKLFFTDTGLLCHLLGIRHAGDLALHPLRGAIFENFVVAELRKLFLHHGERPPLYFWRDSHGHEVDVIIDLGQRLLPVEIKASETVTSHSLRGLEYFRTLSGMPDAVLVHGGPESYQRAAVHVTSWWHCT